MSVLHFLLVDFGLLVTILEMVADHPWQFTWSKFCQLSLDAKFHVCSTIPSGIFWMVVDQTILGMVGDHPGEGERPSMVLHMVLIL